MTDPVRVGDILPTLTCSATHPVTGRSCRRIGPHQIHSPDGVDHWEDTTSHPGDTATPVVSRDQRDKSRPSARRRVDPPAPAHHPTPRVKTRQIAKHTAKEAHL